MCKKIVFLMVFAALAMPLRAGIPEVLRSVEENNLSLQAQRQTAAAKSLEARMGNSLGDLSVSYSHLRGADPASGRVGEAEVTQSFDFPTVYADRARVAKALAREYDNEYTLLRQQILLEAKELCIELRSLRRLEGIMLSRLEANDHLRRLYSAKLDSGDATILDRTRIDNEYLLLQEGLSECSLRVIEVRGRLASLNGGQSLDTILDDGLGDGILEELRPFEELYADYGESDPQLLAVRLRESTSERELKLSRAQAIPKFELGYKHDFAPGEKFNGVTAGISIPIFSNRHNVQRAKASRAAAVLEARAAEVESEAILAEMYEKALLLAASLDRYDTLPAADGYTAMLDDMLERGAINLVDYYAELYAFYDVAEARIRLERDYLTLVARINMVYL